jgi:Asp-tRNA(Asn)/Glu-tRNA(Gln) amidotransferase C subunit
MSRNFTTQNPLIRAVLQSKSSEKPMIGSQTPRRDIPISRRIASLLEAPTWSVRSLLPSPDAITTPEDVVTKEKLHHLLRLSALPPPKSELAEAKLLKTLQAQIHFVKEIRKVDTTGIEPLRAIRDETTEAIEDETITLRDLQPFLDKEEKYGRNGRLRRRKDVDHHGDENAHTWDPFGMSADRSKKHGTYFVVKRPKKFDA